MSARRRSGFTLFDLVALIAIIIIVGGMVLTAIAKARTIEAARECTRNLKVIVLAAHNCNDTYGRLPPGVGTLPPAKADRPANFGNALFFLLPFIEHNLIYRQSVGEAVAPGGAVAGKANDGTANWPKAGTGSYAGVNWAGYNRVFAEPIKTFQCPADPTIPATGFCEDSILAGYVGSTSADAKGESDYFSAWGLSSYSLNAQVFMAVDTNPGDRGPAGRPAGDFGGEGKTTGGKYHENGGRAGKPLGYGYFKSDPDRISSLDGAASLDKSFPDGLSNTILASERLARCTSENPTLAQPFHIGGAYWAYDGVDRNDDRAPSICFGSNAGVNKPTDTSGWLPASYTAGKKPEPTPVFPFFSWTLWDGPGTPYYKAGNLISVGPASRPLFKPTPYSGKSSRCDPRLASTSHDTLPVAMADGSVRDLSPNISGDTWWFACTPNGGEVLGPDW